LCFLSITEALHFLSLLLVNLRLELLDLLGESAHPLGMPLLRRLWSAGHEDKKPATTTNAKARRVN